MCKFNILLFISEEAELQCVPGHFESVEEYIRVFEPLLFEECRAQMYSSWEESTETISSHVKVHIRNIERRERGTFELCLHIKSRAFLCFLNLIV